MQVKVQCQVHLSESLWFDWFIVSFLWWIKSFLSHLLSLYFCHTKINYICRGPSVLSGWYGFIFSLSLCFSFYCFYCFSLLLFSFVCMLLSVLLGGTHCRFPLLTLRTFGNPPPISNYLISSHKPDSGWLSFFAGLLNNLVSEVLAASVCVLP